MSIYSRRGRFQWLFVWLLGLGLLVGCGQLQFDWGPLLYAVTVTPDQITPNADGDQDVTRVAYALRRSAAVSIYFTDDAGETYYFRRDRRRGRGEYTVLWGGTAEESEVVATGEGTQEILSRVLPDGNYRWTVAATDDLGNSERVTGTVTLRDGDSELPLLKNFAVVPDTFRPNQDGLRDDWVSISYYLSKDVDSLIVYLLDPTNPTLKYYITQEPGLAEPTEAGYKEYRYEGDVDKNAEPPPDGTYTIVGEARDRAGNAVRVTGELTIAEGGQPFAEIDQGEIDWYVVEAGAEENGVTPDEEKRVLGRTISLHLGDQLCFRAVVHNYGTTPIRTAGPWPGQQYLFTENRNSVARQHMDATASAADPVGDKSWLRQTGVWRFGINFESTGVDFPFRWAVGQQQDLERRLIDGNEQWYLLPGDRSEVSGCILINQPPLLNTNIWWGGLIHEDVATVNNDIDRITVVVEALATDAPTGVVEALATDAPTGAASSAMTTTRVLTSTETVTTAAPPTATSP